MAVRYPIVRVFITKGYKFRACIKETPTEPIYEVTVNGREWLKGKGRHHRAEIMRKCAKIINTLNTNLPV